MPTWLKVILVLLLAGVVCIAGLIGAGVYLWKKHGPQFVQSVTEGEKEGRDFGAKTENQACVDEGVKRYRDATGMTELMRDSIFVRSCLEASRETPGFCDAVPGPFEFTKTIQWRKEQCERYGMTEQQQCGQLFQTVQQYCESHKLKSSINSNTEDGDNSNH
jgi:hypothetical protein